MQRVVALATILVCAACGGQTVADPCTIRINVIEISNIPINATRTVEADVTVRAGTCNDSAKDLSWKSSRPEVAEITASTDSSATVAGRRAGSSTIVAYLTRTPSVRDSISVNVVTITEN